MTRGRAFFLIVSGVVVASILSGTLLGAPASQESEGEDSLYRYLSVFTEVLRLVRQAYVDDLDLRPLMAGALEGTSDALDPFSMFIPAGEVASYLEARRIGSDHSGLRVVKVRGTVYVVAVLPGSPAQVLGLDRGDILTEIDGFSSHDMPLWDIEQRLAAAPASKVKLQVFRRGETEELTLELATFEMPRIALEDVDGAHLLRIPRFDAGNLAEASRLVAGIRGEDLIVDVRGTAWGEEEVAYDVARLFVAGDLGVLLGKDGPVKSFSGGEAAWTGRLVVLVDRGTQGGAEILASVLREGAGARVVGQTTFGFAGHPRFMDLDSGGTMLITDSFYTGPGGEPINEGIEPDVSVGDSIIARASDGSTLDDRILERGLEELRSEGSALDKAA